MKRDMEKQRAWERRSRKPMRSKRKRQDAGFWARRSRECVKRDGQCRRCRSRLHLGSAHIIGVGGRGTRHDSELDLNELRNLVALCWPCHDKHDNRRLWKWADIGVVSDPELVRRYGWRE